MADVQFHPEAQDEYDAAVRWYQARSVQAADRFEGAVQRLISLIEAQPESFPLYDDEHPFAVVRRFPYSLVYQVLPDVVFVVAVPHSSRAPGYPQGRRG